MNKKVQGTDNLYLNAVKKIYINNFDVEGSKGAVNGKIMIDCEDFVAKNVTIANGCTAYNVFE